MVESVLSSKSVSQWKFEDKFEDRQATLPSCTWKETEDAFFHGPYKNIGSWIEVSELSSSVLLLDWRNCLCLCFALNSSLPGTREAAESSA